MADRAADLRRIVGRLRARGFSVTEVPGWESRGRGPMTTKARVEHHTAGGTTGDSPSLRVVTFGRSGLRNSLSRWFVSRSGKIYLVALGVSWHAGRGVKVTNTTSSGTEAQHSGTRSEPWTAGSLAAQRAISQEECREFGVPHSRVWDHREHAPGRKIDRISIDSHAWRRSLSAGNPPAPAPTPAPSPTGDEEDIVSRLPTLKRRTDLGRASDADRRLQGLLAAAGFLDLSPVNIRDGRPDGLFGPSTERAVKTFQSRNGLTVDGIVGDRTWRKLLGV